MKTFVIKAAELFICCQFVLAFSVKACTPCEKPIYSKVKPADQKVRSDGGVCVGRLQMDAEKRR